MRLWPKKQRRLLTDVELLEAIFERHYDDFIKFGEAGRKPRSSVPYVPVEIEALGRDLNVDSDVIFGQLYHHLQNKYGYKRDDSEVPFFALSVGPDPPGDRHCVHFPYLAAVLAGLRADETERRRATVIAIVSLVLSIASILISVVRK